jgi:hypothetical protein
MSNSLEAVLSQYEQNKQEAQRPKQTPKMTDEERLQKYFSPQLPEKQTTGEAVIRILPTADGSSPFVPVYFHEIKLDGKFVKLYDPGMNEGKPSPLNETHASLIATGTKKDKDLAKQYKSKKFWIVKLIDRANEDHGPKFWRFKDDSWKNEGPLDKIIPIYRKKGDIADAKEGRDLTLILTEQKTPTGIRYTSVSSIMAEDASPLSTNEVEAQAWLNDPMTWETVYSKKPLDYLEGVAQGFSPKWSKALKKYTWGSQDEVGSELTSSGTSADQFLQEEPVEANVADEASDDDLPF